MSGDSTDDGATAESGGRPRWLLPAALAGLVAVVVALVAAVMLGSGDDASTIVALEPAGSDGPAPFTDSVSLTERDDLAEPVAVAATDTLETLDVDPDTGTAQAPGDTPGLYGGSGDGSTCDTAMLESFLTERDNTAQARAWTGVLDVDADAIPSYLSGLTPTVLIVDTRVTNHGFDDGAATARQSVLQAGTAVLVDEMGVPRVRCSCGNPLLEPERIDLTTATTSGSTWSGYDVKQVVSTVASNEPMTTFTLVDLDDGRTFERDAGSGVPGIWVAVAGEGTADGRRGSDEGPGSIHVSDDGSTWEEVLGTEGALNAVAVGDDRFVAVGAGPQGGTILASDNGSAWSEPVPTEVPIVDVAWGDGTWVALAQDRTYTSDDGANWTEGEPLPFEFDGIDAGAIAFGDGEFLVSTYSCGGSGCSVTSPLASPDGASWSPSDIPLADTGVRSPSIAYASGLGVVGYAFGDAPDDAPMVDIPVEPFAATIDDTGASVVPQAPDGPFLRGLSSNGDTWLAVGAPGGLFAEAPSGVYTSTDLSGWTRIGEVDARLNDVVVSPRTGGSPVEPPASSTITTTPTAETSGVVLTEAGFRVGDQEYSTASTPASEARAALTDVLGEPSRATPIGNGVCTPGQYVWGELELIEFNESNWYFSLGSPNAAGDSVKDRVATDAGVRLGDPIAEFQAQYPSTRQIETDYGDTAFWADSSGDGRGLLAFAADGTAVSSLSGGAEDPTFVGDC